MILFVTGQYASGQYLHPLLKLWEGKVSNEWELVATGPSCGYWDKFGVPYKTIKDNSPMTVASYIKSLKPSVIMVSASANIDLEHVFITEARKALVPSACFIDTWINYRPRFQYQGKLLLPDHVLAIDDRCADELVADRIPEKVIHIVGQPYLEEVAFTVPALGPNTLLVSQPISKNQWRNLGYDEKDFYKVCIKAVNKLGMSNIYGTRHPDESVNAHMPDSSSVVWVEGKDALDVASSHTLLGMFSMQMIIGYLWGRKVASVQPKLNMDDPSPLSRWGLIPRLEKVEEIIDFINERDVKVCDEGFKNNLAGSLDRFESFCLGESI